MLLNISALLGCILFALTCTNATAQASGISKEDADRAANDAKYYEWKRRSAERQIDIAPLRESLLKAGGRSLNREQNWEKFPKSLLIAVEVKNVEIFNGFGNSGKSILAKWRKEFDDWCESAGGKMSERNASRVVRDYLAYNLSANNSLDIDGKPVTLIGGNEQEIGCFDKVGLEFGLWDQMVGLTLLRTKEDPRTRQNANDLTSAILIGLTDQDLKYARIALREAQQKKYEADRQIQDAKNAKYNATRAEWMQQSLTLQNQLKVGDAGIVLLELDNRTIAAPMMVVELKRPIAYVQFSNVTPNMRWVKIEEILTSPVPNMLRCGMNPGRGCIQ